MSRTSLSWTALDKCVRDYSGALLPVGNPNNHGGYRYKRIALKALRGKGLGAFFDF